MSSKQPLAILVDFNYKYLESSIILPKISDLDNSALLSSSNVLVRF